VTADALKPADATKCGEWQQGRGAPNHGFCFGRFFLARKRLPCSDL
jgi:hypothetical protein